MKEVVMTIISRSGWKNQMNGKQIPNMREYKFLEHLYEKLTIKDFTDDGWIQVGNKWLPVEYGLRKLGDNVYNEYIEYCR